MCLAVCGCTWPRRVNNEGHIEWTYVCYTMRKQTTTKQLSLLQLHGFHLVHIASAAALKLLLFGQSHTTVLPPDAKAHKRDNYHCDCDTHHQRDINTIVGGRGYIPLNV